MAELKFQIPDDRMDDLVDAWGRDYMDTLTDGSPNPQTKPQFARKRIMDTIVQRVREHEANQLPEFPIT